MDIIIKQIYKNSKFKKSYYHFLQEMIISTVVVLLYCLLLYYCIKSETNRFLCDDNRPCTTITISNSETSEKKKIIKLMDIMKRLTYWRKAFIGATIISILVNFCYQKHQNIKDYLSIFLPSFLVIYFMDSFDNFHFLSPIYENISIYINKN